MARATARLRATVWGELLAEFLGTLVLIAFGDGVVAMAVAALNQSGRGTEIFAASGRLAADRLGMGAGGRLRRLRRRRGERGPHQPGGHPGPGRQARLPLAQGGAVHGGPGAGGVRRGRARVPRLPRRHLQLRGGQAHHPRGARRAGRLHPDLQHLRHLPRPLLRLQPGRSAGRPDRGHGLPAHVRTGPHRRAQPAPQVEPGPAAHRPGVAAIGMSFGANAGYAINPARDLGPRFLAWLTGWGEVAFPGVHGYFWVPVVGPLVGGVVGAVVYDLFVGDILLARGAPPAPDVEGFGETVEEQPTTADGQVEVRGRTVRER